MRVNVPNLNVKTTELKNLIKVYDDNFLNFYNIMKYTENNWQDPNSIEFFKTVKIEKLKSKNTHEELQNLANVYEYVVSRYGEFGKVIYAELKNKDAILAKIEAFISEIEGVISSFNGIDASFSGESGAIETQKARLSKVKISVKNIKNEVKRILEKMEETEKIVNSKLSGIDIEIITETDIKPYL